MFYFQVSRSEWQQVFRTYHPLLLEALADGVVLWDRGEFAAMRAQFQHWQREGQVQPWRSRWKIAFKADADSPDGRADER